MIIYTNILRGGSGDIDPGLGEECARAEHEQYVEQSVKRVLCDVREGLRRGQVVAETPHGVGAGGAAAPHVGPYSEQVHQEVSAEFHRQHLSLECKFIYRTHTFQ